MNYYKMLGVSQNSKPEDIKRAYRRLVKECHPDINDTKEAAEATILLNEAYATLMDSSKRAQHDRELALFKTKYSSLPNETQDELREIAKYWDAIMKKRRIQCAKVGVLIKWSGTGVSLVTMVASNIIVPSTPLMVNVICLGAATGYTISAVKGMQRVRKMV